MKAAVPSRRDRLRQMLADLRMPGALTHPALTVVDGIGYLPISRTGAMLFFQLMTRRYEHTPSRLPDVARQYCVPTKIVDVGVANRQATTRCEL